MADRKTRARTIKMNRARAIEQLEARQLMTVDLAAGVSATVGPLSESTLAPPVSAQPPIETIAPVQAETQEITLPTDLPEQFATTINVGGETLTLNLRRHSVFGENTRFLVDDGSGELTEVELGEERTYLGVVEEGLGFDVTAILTERGLTATILRPGQPTLLIEPDLNGELGEHLVFEQQAIEWDPLAHDHDGDGVADHAPGQHDNYTGGGHPPGCTCANCCAAGEAGEPEIAALTPDAIVPAEPLPADQAAGGSPLADATAPSTATLAPTRVLDVYEFEVGVEIGSAAFLNNYDGDLSFAQSVAQGIAANLDARYLHATGIKYRIGTVIIRTSAAEDQFNVANGNDRNGLNAFRDYWNNNPQEVGNTHDLAVYHVRSSPSGLAFVGTAGTSSGYALSASNGPTSWADGTLVHEFGHSWNLGHASANPQSTDAVIDNVHVGTGLFYENRPRSGSGASTAGGIEFFISPMNGSGNHNIGRFATDEAQRIIDRRNLRLSAGDRITNPAPTKPFGHRDTAFVGSDPVVLDVIANDYDINNDVLDVRLLDTVSFLGGRISLSVGTGPGGRSELIYTPPASGGDGDFFHYTVVDSTGRTDFGAVHVESSFLAVDTSLDFFSYDPGTSDSPVFEGPNDFVATQLIPSVSGQVNWTGSVQAIDRGDSAGNAYNRDLIFGTTPAEFSHALRPGLWRVTVNMSDAEVNLDNQFVIAEGGQAGIPDLDSPIGSNPTRSFNVAVVDGELNLQFGDADSVNPRWAVNRINIELIEEFTPPLLAGDYNGDGAIDLADYTVWRDSLNQTVATPFDGADGNGDGTVDLDDYDVWRENFGDRLAGVTLIDATTGNGEFAIESEADAIPINGGDEELVFDLNRDRVFRGTSGGSRGIAFDGWRITRETYPGGNPALGLDGNFGLAPPPESGTGPGESGQVFVNSGSVELTSDPIVRNFTPGEVLDLSFQIGSDTPGTIQATAELIFDEGLPTVRIQPLALRSASGLSTPAFNEQYTLVESASSVSVRFLLDGVESGRRALLDSVVLDLTTTENRLAANAASSQVAAVSTPPQPVAQTAQAPAPSEAPATGAIVADSFVIDDEPFVATTTTAEQPAPAPSLPEAEILAIAAAQRSTPQTSDSNAASRDLALADPAPLSSRLNLLYTDQVREQEEDELDLTGAPSETESIDSAFDEFGLDGETLTAI